MASATTLERQTKGCRRGRSSRIALLLACLAAAGAAQADVLEIGDDGAVQVRSGGAAVVWNTAVSAGDQPEAPDVPEAALTMIIPPDMPAAYRAPLAKAASRSGVSPDLLAALVAQESGWRERAVSRKGALGLTQLMPGTARSLAVDPRDPAANLVGGAHYLRVLLDAFGGDLERALAAYNAGPGRVARAGGVPAIAETRAYVSAILDRLGPERPRLAQR